MRNRRRLSRYLDRYVELTPLKYEEISGNPSKEFSEKDKVRYLRTLKAYKERTQFKIYMSQLIDDDSRFQWYLKYHYVISNLKVSNYPLKRWNVAVSKDTGKGIYLKVVVNVAFYDGEYHIACSWYGLDDLPPSWEPLKTIYETAPDPVMRYLEDNQDTEPHKTILNDLRKNHLSRRAVSSLDRLQGCTDIVYTRT